ncbi:hypothetical protein MUK42_35560 [Musa troglodytarum]|uniref:Tify domain-containing protein n=1 Tax=Musa troglodytarum TaxID=320322 RepID=A0A9E7KPM9_9LILI|nr:hypothetical protein MUK42_35560 [Musa troglodytarum]
MTGVKSRHVGRWAPPIHRPAGRNRGAREATPASAVRHPTSREPRPLAPCINYRKGADFLQCVQGGGLLLRASGVPDGGGEAVGARREESIDIVRIGPRDGEGFLGNSREGFGPADVEGGHRREPPGFRHSAVAFLEQGAYHAAIHILQGCARGEANKLSFMNTHLLDSNRYQPLMPLRPISNMPNATTNMTARPTIFCRDFISVHVNVPSDKAQEIMLLARRGSTVTLMCLPQPQVLVVAPMMMSVPWSLHAGKKSPKNQIQFQDMPRDVVGDLAFIDAHVFRGFSKELNGKLFLTHRIMNI